MELKVEKITPAIAVQYLKANKDNYRKINRGTVNRYAEDMKAGKWELNGEAIIFGANGILKNGQHRLAAIALAGIPVMMTVIRGVEDDVRIFDVGGNRTVNQIASANDVAVSKSLAAAASIIVNNFGQQIKGKTVDYVRQNVSELSRAERISGVKNGGFKKASCIVAIYLMLRNGVMPSYEAELFMKVFQSGETFGTDGYETSSALVARRMFEQRRKEISQRAQKEQLDILCQAMTDFHEGKVRVQAYKVSEPFSFEPLMKKVWEKDGLR
jgi:hypothetical protein